MLKCRIEIKENQIMRTGTSSLFGIFIEDINYACDGGLNANQLNNHSFEGIYNEKRINEAKRLCASYLGQNHRIRLINDPLRFWKIQGSVTARMEGAMQKERYYARIHAPAYLKNQGYNGGGTHLQSPAIYVQKGHYYIFSCYARNLSFQGVMLISVNAKKGQLTDSGRIVPLGEWNLYQTIFLAKRSGFGEFVLQAEGRGILDLDELSFMDADYWGRGNLKWSQGKLRRDLVEAIQKLHPAFCRFPGGCIVEGYGDGNEYEWKHTIGEIPSRKQKLNLWSLRTSTGYVQSNQVGFYEYFLLCEDLHMMPVPVVWAGLHCQLRGREHVINNQMVFEERVIRNALDLLDYALANPKENRWAAMRAAAGHPKPFDLSMIEIGNENFGKYYWKAFDKIQKEIRKKYPKILCILNTRPLISNYEAELFRRKAGKTYNAIFTDEHYYHFPIWFIRHAKTYNRYCRTAPPVMIGEYAACGFCGISKIANTYWSALAEAAYLTGIERNSDIVRMAAYAPLLARIGGLQWNHNLIYFNSRGVLKTTNYLVQKIYGSYHGDLIPYSRMMIDSAIYSKNVFYSVTQDERKIYLKIVNTGRQCIHFSIQIENKEAQIGTIMTMQSNHLLAKNQMSFSGVEEKNVRIRRKMVVIQEGRMSVFLQKYCFYLFILERKKK